MREIFEWLLGLVYFALSPHLWVRAFQAYKVNKAYKKAQKDAEFKKQEKEFIEKIQNAKPGQLIEYSPDFYKSPYFVFLSKIGKKNGEQ